MGGSCIRTIRTLSHFSCEWQHPDAEVCGDEVLDEGQVVGLVGDVRLVVGERGEHPDGDLVGVVPRVADPLLFPQGQHQLDVRQHLRAPAWQGRRDPVGYADPPLPLPQPHALVAGRDAQWRERVVVDEREVDAPGVNEGKRLVWLLLLEHKPHAGVRCGELAHDREQSTRGGREARDAERSLRLGVWVEVAPGLVEAREDPGCSRRESCTRGCQPHPASDPLQEARAELLLEEGELLGDHRGGCQVLVRNGPHRAEAVEVDEVLEPPSLHVRSRRVLVW